VAAVPPGAALQQNLLLYYITDRMQFPGDEAARRRCLLNKIAEAARCGVDFVQLREKDLGARDLEALARTAFQIVRESHALRTKNRQLAAEKPTPDSENSEGRTRLLINSRTDVALAVGADGVHLRGNDISPSEVRKIWKQRSAGTPSASLMTGLARENPQATPVITVSCHTVQDLARALADAADFAVFAPVFEKHAAPAIPAAGLGALRQACRCHIPVLALGGVSLQNASACVDAGAAGIAAIRLFQENEIADIVHALRA
jgi:thiamine-phosphate pyrophosphorylase